MNFGKSSQIWATMTFTNFLKALLILQIYDKAMGVRGNQSWTRCLTGTWCQIWRGLDPAPQFSSSEEFLLSKEETDYGCMCVCLQQHSGLYWILWSGFLLQEVPRRAFLTQMRQLSLQPPQCPFPSISWSGCMLCVPPTSLCDDRTWGGFSETSGLD